MQAGISCFVEEMRSFNVRNVIAIEPVQSSTETSFFLIGESQGGELSIFKATKSNSKLNISQKLLLVVGKGRVSCIIPCRFEFEDIPISNNAILTAFDDGQIMLNDIYDGRSLFSTVLECTLNCIGRVFILDDWASSFLIFPGDLPHQDNLIISTYSGSIVSFTFDEKLCDIVPSNLKIITPTISESSFQLKGGILSRNVWDSGVFVCLKHNACLVYQVKDHNVKLVLKIPSIDEKKWRGCAFISMRTLIIWSNDLICYIYYLGDSKDLVVNDKDSLVDHNLILVAANDNGNACFVDRRNCFKELALGLFCLVCVLKPSGNSLGTDGDVCIVPLNRGAVYAFGFFTDSEVLFWDVTLRSNESLSSHLKIESSVLGEKLAKSISFDKKIKPTSMKNYISSAIMVLDKYIAIGFSNGTIKFQSIYELFRSEISESPNRENFEFSPKGYFSSRLFEGHTDKVTSMVYLRFMTGLLSSKVKGEKKHILASGSADGTVRIWNLRSGALLSTFLLHSSAVYSLIPFIQSPDMEPADGVGIASALNIMRIKSGLISIGFDNTVCIIDIEDKNRFVGHSSTVCNLHWKASDEFLAVECEDGAIFLWQLKTGHLDRVETNPIIVEDILSEFDWTISAKPESNDSTQSNRSTFSIYHKQTTQPVKSYFTIMINIKKLITDIYKGDHTIRHQISGNEETNTEEEEDPDQPSNQPPKPLNSSVTLKKKEDVNAHEKRVSSSKNTMANVKRNILHPRSRLHHPETPDLTKHMSLNTSLPLLSARTGDKNVISGVLSALLSWGLDKEMDRICVDEIGLEPCGKHITLANRGVNGYLSIPLPDLDEDGDSEEEVALLKSRNHWSISGFVTANRLLHVIPLMRSILTSKGLEDEISALASHYGALLPKSVGNQYCYPSFSVLAKHLHDPLIDVQEAAKTIFISALAVISHGMKSEIISYWTKYLPVFNGKFSLKFNYSATIILGMFVVSDPTLLNDLDCKNVAESLFLLIKTDPKSIYTISAVDIIGRGFSIWERHVASASVLRTIIILTGLSRTEEKDKSPQKAPPNTPPPISPALMAASRLAVVHIASINSALFTSTVTFDLSHSKTVSERTVCLKLLGMFISKKPLLLYPTLPNIVEAVVKSLDPNTPYLRDALQPLITLNLSELVRTYPMVSFNAHSQKLAVGTTTGQIVTYDLRTASRIGILEQGNAKPVAAVSISRDGKLIVSFCLEENCVRFWHPSGGFLGALVGAFGGGGGNVGGGGSANMSHSPMKIFRQFVVGPPEVDVSIQRILDEVKFEWVSERSVKFQSLNKLELALTI